jgi:hypothetical protein
MNYKIYKFVLITPSTKYQKTLIYLQPSPKLNISSVGNIVFS